MTEILQSVDNDFYFEDPMCQKKTKTPTSPKQRPNDELSLYISIKLTVAAKWTLMMTSYTKTFQCCLPAALTSCILIGWFFFELPALYAVNAQ